MRTGSWARLMLAVAPILACFLSGCGNFWQAPNSGSFSLSNGGNILEGLSTSATSTITVTAGSSFSGTVTLSCAVTTSVSSATDPTCGLSSTSISTSGTSTLTATTTSSTTLGLYTVTVTGTSGSTSKTTSVCVNVTTSTTSSCTSTASTSGDFYILNSNSLAGYNIKSGVLTALSGNSQTVTGATALAINPAGTVVYVASTAGGITSYTIASTGALTAGSTISQDTLAQAIQVDPSGKWLLDASSNGTITAMPITSSGTEDGSRSPFSQPLAAISVNQMAISPDGALIAVALGSTGTQALTFNSNLASPLGTPSSAIAPKTSSSGSAISVAIDPQSRYLYIGEVNAVPSDPNNNTGGLRGFTINSTTLTPFATVYSSGGLAPHFILPNAAGTYVYVANGQGNSQQGNVTAFSVATSALSEVSSVAAGTQPLSLAQDSTGSFVFEVGSSGSPYFDAYSLNASTGQLTSQVTSTSVATSIAIVAAP